MGGLVALEQDLEGLVEALQVDVINDHSLVDDLLREIRVSFVVFPKVQQIPELAHRVESEVEAGGAHEVLLRGARLVFITLLDRKGEVLIDEDSLELEFLLREELSGGRVVALTHIILCDIMNFSKP